MEGLEEGERDGQLVLLIKARRPERDHLLDAARDAAWRSAGRDQTDAGKRSRIFLMDYGLLRH